MNCCESILTLPCAYSCDTIQIGINAPATGNYTIELQPDGVKVVTTANTIGTPLVFPGGYLNEDAVHVFKIIKPDGTYLESGIYDCFQLEIKPTINAAFANVDITPIACEGAIAVLKNTLGTTISTTEIDSGASEDISAPDADYVLKDADGLLLSTGSIPSDASEDITAPNAVVNLRNSANTLISINNFRSGTTYNLIAPDATAVVKDQNGNILDTEAIPSNVSEDIIITLPQLATIYFAFTAGTDTSALFTNPDTTLTLTALAQDGASGTITVSVNGGAYAAFVNPTTVNNAQTLQVKRTSTGSAGSVTITGTYA